MAHQQEHPIFRDIDDDNLAAVQQRVLGDAAVLEERETSINRRTPLMHAILSMKPAIALWLLEYREQHDLETADGDGWTALHWALHSGSVAIVQALMAAGANPAALTNRGETPLIWASSRGHTDILAYLLQLPAVNAGIDHISQDQATAISIASFQGHQTVVQPLLNAGSDPTIPAGPHSPLSQAVSNNHHVIAALLCHPIAMADCARALHKARSLLAAEAGAASLSCLQGRVEQGQAPPQLGLVRWGRSRNEGLQATPAFAVGMSSGEKDTGLCDELFVELPEYMVPAWADKGPEA